MAQEGVAAVAKKPTYDPSKGSNVRLDADVVKMLKKLASFTDDSMGEIASRELRAVLPDMLHKAMAEDLANWKPRPKKKD